MVMEPATTRAAPTPERTLSGSEATTSGHRAEPMRIISRVAIGVNDRTALTREASQWARASENAP